MSAKEKLKERFQQIQKEKKNKINTPINSTAPIENKESEKNQGINKEDEEKKQKETDTNVESILSSSPVKILIERHNTLEKIKKNETTVNKSKDAKELIPEQKVTNTLNQFEVKRPKWSTKEGVKKKLNEMTQKKEEEQRKLEEEQKRKEEEIQNEINRKREEEYQKELELKKQAQLKEEEKLKTETPPNGRVSLRYNITPFDENKTEDTPPISPRVAFRMKADLHLLPQTYIERRESIDQSKNEEIPIHLPLLNVQSIEEESGTNTPPNRLSLRDGEHKDLQSFNDLFGKGNSKKMLSSFRTPHSIDILKSPVPTSVLTQSPRNQKVELTNKKNLMEEIYIKLPEIQFDEIITPSELFLSDFNDIIYSIEKKEIPNEDHIKILENILNPPTNFLSWYELNQYDLIIPEPNCKYEEIPTFSEEFLDPKEAEIEVGLENIVDIVKKTEKPKPFKIEKLDFKRESIAQTPRILIPQTPKESSPSIEPLDLKADPNIPKMSGYMMININKTWTKRYFIIKGENLFGYEDETLSKELENILLKVSLIDNLPNEVAIKEFQMSNIIKISNTKKSTYLLVENNEDFLTWGIQLRKAALIFSGNMILVDKNGGGQAKTIQDALNKAKNLDKIILKQGIYEEAVIINKLVHIEGKDVLIKSKKGPCFTVSTNGAVKISGISCEGNDTNFPCILLKTGNLTLSGCEIRSGKDSGIQALSNTQLTISKTLVAGNNKSGIQMMSNTTGIFDRVHLGQNQGDGINFSPQVLCNITKSTFLQNDGYGLCLTGETFCISDHNTFVKNKLSGFISLNPKSIILLRKNEFIDNQMYGCEFPTKKLDPNEFQTNNKFTNNIKGIIKSL